MASKKSQYLRPWHVLPATILSVDHRCADLLRRMIANKILSSELRLQTVCREKLFALRKDKKDESDAEVGIVKVKQDEYIAECKLTKEEELRLEDTENLDRPFVMELCKNANNRFESLIKGEGSHEEEEFIRLCEGDAYFKALRDRAVKKRQWDLKYPRTEKLIKIMEMQKITVPQLMQIVTGEKRREVDADNQRRDNQRRDNQRRDNQRRDNQREEEEKQREEEKKQIMPPIEFTFQEESSDLINKINDEYKHKLQDIARRVMDDSKYEDFKCRDCIPTTTFGLEDSSRKKEEKEKIDTPHAWLKEIREYRNDLVHSSADEIAMEKLYGREVNTTKLGHPYVQFLRYVNFKEYFPSDVLEQKVRHLLNPLATGAEIDLVLKNYKDLLEKLDIQHQEILEKEDEVRELEETTVIQRLIIQEDCEKFKLISMGGKMRKILDHISKNGAENPRLVTAGLKMLHLITVHMEMGIPDNLFNVLRNLLDEQI